VEEQDKIETEDTDVEGHKLAEKVDVHAASEEGEDDEPDVEGHKLANKVANKFDV
jgi:hypothetical protein